MSRASREVYEAISVFQRAVASNEFTVEEMKAMLVLAADLMNDFEINRIIAITEKQSLADLKNIVNP